MSELAQALGYFTTTMKADTALVAAATGGVWSEVADLGVIAPYALVAWNAGVDTLTLNAVRLFSRMQFQLKAVGPSSSYATLVTIANRIDVLFGSTSSVALSSGGVLECYRLGPLSYPDIVNGQPWSHLGGLYSIDLQGS